MQRIIVETDEAEQIEVDIDVWRNRQQLHEGEAVELSWQDEAAVELNES